MSLIFITGIDTGVGKTLATGLLARSLRERGKKAITFKPVQTGNREVSEDLLLHRRIMGMEWSKWDEKGITCPYLFSFPASPHLAARLENRRIEEEEIDRCIQILTQNFEIVLMEGAGGLQVPLNENITFLDFIARRNVPVVVVSSSRLGSINHTLLTLEALQNRHVSVEALLYNCFPQTAPEIAEDNKEVFRRFYPSIPLVEIPFLSPQGPFPSLDFFFARKWPSF